jgi:hypothetical protein
MKEEHRLRQGEELVFLLPGLGNSSREGNVKDPEVL